MHSGGPRSGSLPQVEIEESALPNTPKITAGPVVAHESRGAAVTNGVPALAQGSENFVT